METALGHFAGCRLARSLSGSTRLPCGEANGAPFFTWGYHRDWHGNITRPDIDAICPDRPVIVWHRSFHEVIMNSAALAHFNLETDAIAAHPQIDLPAGKFLKRVAACHRRA